MRYPPVIHKEAVVGVLFQAFYWDCPAEESRDGNWWNFVAGKIPELQQAGITALWLPPASKAANIGGPSMGYDPYDYYDLGDFNQRSRTKTWFGNQAELTALINIAHTANMQVYADLVLDHNNGGDELETNPIDGKTRWTKFTPASGKFPRDWQCFHPSPYGTFDEMSFGDMPDLCHRNPKVYSEMIYLAQWMVENIGFDGFRFDFVKGYAPWMVKAIAELRYLNKSAQGFYPFCVGECWDGERTIDDWLTTINSFMDNPVSAFDFPLHYRLKDLCDTYGFSLRTLASPGTVVQDSPSQAVTFVDNHDSIRDPGNAIVHDKLLAYSFILTHEGYPSIFWMDWYNYGLAKTGTANGIAALVSAHERYAGGTTRVLYSDDSLYLMQRAGAGAQPGLVYVLNNLGDRWNGALVQTPWHNTGFEPVAWGGYDPSRPDPKTTDGDGHADFWAGPRGWAVYAPA
jgi:alpha-amylase